MISVMLVTVLQLRKNNNSKCQVPGVGVGIEEEKESNTKLFDHKIPDSLLNNSTHVRKICLELLYKKLLFCLFTVI